MQSAISVSVSPEHCSELHMGTTQSSFAAQCGHPHWVAKRRALCSSESLQVEDNGLQQQCYTSITTATACTVSCQSYIVRHYK
eukprot:14645-Heterococcus_DN1.PRE.3